MPCECSESFLCARHYYELLETQQQGRTTADLRNALAGLGAWDLCDLVGRVAIDCGRG